MSKSKSQNPSIGKITFFVVLYLIIAFVGIGWMANHDYFVGDQFEQVGVVVQATLGVAAILLVSMLLYRIAKRTDSTYRNQLKLQKWQRFEEFTQFAEEVVRKGLEQYSHIAYSISRQIGINISHFDKLNKGQVDLYYDAIRMQEWDTELQSHIRSLYTDFHARAIAHSPFWKSNPSRNLRDVLRLDVQTEPVAVPLNALVTCQAFVEIKEKKPDNNPLAIPGNPLVPWLHSTYFSRYGESEFRTAPFPALLALVDLMPSLFNVIAHLDSYLGYFKNGKHLDEQLKRFQHYLRIPSISALLKIHGIEDAETLRRYLETETAASSQFRVVDSSSLESIFSENRAKELKFWFGPYEQFFSQIYGATGWDLAHSSTDDLKVRMHIYRYQN
jgi:hypothetical protein